MPSSLQQLLDQRQLWRGRDTGEATAVLPTGWPQLDRELYGAGWPMASLSELLCREPVLAWQLLLPALVQLSQQQRLLIWIGHEQPPYAPAWQKAGLCLSRCLLVRASEDEAPWAAEQALRLAQGGAVLLQSKALNTERLRRLQLAAQSGGSYAFLLRPPAAQRQTTPASLRMQLQAAPGGVQVQVLKRRGGAATTTFTVPTSPAPRAVVAPGFARNRSINGVITSAIKRVMDGAGNSASSSARGSEKDSQKDNAENRVSDAGSLHLFANGTRERSVRDGSANAAGAKHNVSTAASAVMAVAHTREQAER
ncbi:translesion DNA synthesis-associated protein ImuA [Permianibacter sp. IMCC34836]|uniref:translesion DNA synthesis-associated protein ImuA n=1 Tax=Permianibacter fluminis TaxID=2738515 RepID=UPI00155521FC|nr:translesion DNA synthesis-associated protein ImuA [Permianibacter fluminis]NQD37701.1 translesion DNA synthesis-associated protein ImuA [Permianibacter fluminis]